MYATILAEAMTKVNIRDKNKLKIRLFYDIISKILLVNYEYEINSEI